MSAQSSVPLSTKSDWALPRTVLLVRPVLIFVFLVIAAGAAVLTTAALQWDGDDLALLGTLAGFAILAERFDIRLFSYSRVSVSTVPVLAAGTVAGLPGIAVVATAAVLADYVGRDKPLYKALFNGGAFLVPGAAYVGVFQSFPIGNHSADWPTLILPVLVGTMVNFVLNSALVALVIALDTARRITTVWYENFRVLPAHYLIFGVLVAALASAYSLDGLATMAILFIPVAAMRYIVDLSMANLSKR